MELSKGHLEVVMELLFDERHRPQGGGNACGNGKTRKEMLVMVDEIYDTLYCKWKKM
jgi:hypothetical protein